MTSFSFVKETCQRWWFTKNSITFILNDKCIPPGPIYFFLAKNVWRGHVTTVRKSDVLVRHDSEEEIDPAFREVRERNG